MGGAGVVYGFAGFGSALIFLPIAAILMPLETAIVAFNIGALASVVSVFPAAVKQVDKSAVAILIGASLITVPIGLIFLKAGDPIALRWGVFQAGAIPSRLPTVCARLSVRRQGFWVGRQA